MIISDKDTLVQLLKSGGIAVLRTDTLYGIVARAEDEDAVKRIYTIKGRSRDKPLIVLIASPEDAYDAHVSILQHTTFTRPTTVVVDSPSAPDWLRHHDGSLAYRIPANEELRLLLRRTGPLVAPSANPTNSPPARSIEEAQSYFTTQVDAYVDGGVVPEDAAPSRIIRIESDGSIQNLR